MAIALPNANALIQLQKNQPNGLVGIDANGDVVGTFAQRVGVAADIYALVLASGELAYATDTREMFIGDGVTAGGVFFHSAPIIKTKYHSSLIAVGDTEASQFLLADNAAYKLEIGGNAAALDTISNFAVSISVPNTIIGEFEPTFPGSSSGHRMFATGVWGNNSTGTYIESRVYDHTAGGFPLTVEMAEQTLNGARFKIEAEFKTKLQGTIDVKLVARTTPLPVTSSGFYYASLQRVG